MERGKIVVGRECHFNIDIHCLLYWFFVIAVEGGKGVQIILFYDGVYVKSD